MTTAEEERAFWDFEGRHPEYAIWGTGPWDAGVRHCLAQIVPVVAPALQPGGRILDLGCGIGRLTEPIARLCPKAEVVGLDISPAMIELACASPTRPDNTTYLIGDGRSIPDCGEFDAVYSVLTFQHLDGDTVARYLQQIHLRLGSAGVAVIQCTVDGDDADFHHNHDAGWIVEQAGPNWWKQEIAEDPVYPTWRWITMYDYA